MFKSKERKKKIRRIKELEKAGFNISRFRYLPPESRENKLEEIFVWAEEINNNSPNQIFNIRTYQFFSNSSKETAQTPHLTDLSYEELLEQLPTTNSDYSCLIDAETPDNGRISGNIVIEENNRFSIEFVIKEKRAMVRDINKVVPFSISGRINDFTNLLSKFIESLKEPLTNSYLVAPVVLDFVLKKALSFRKEVIFEFTFFSTPSGIFYNQNKSFPESNLVFWEWRSF